MLNNGIALVESRTFCSAVLALIALVAHQFNWSWLYSFSVNPATADTILKWVEAIGMVGAIVFRAKATAKVTGVIAPKTP